MIKSRIFEMESQGQIMVSEENATGGEEADGRNGDNSTKEHSKKNLVVEQGLIKKL